MKTTKRILALITALVLCLVPMVFMIEAAEIAIRGVNVEVCDCNNPGKPWGSTYVGYTYVYHSHWCKRNDYTGGYFTCLTCGETQAIDGYDHLTPHVWDTNPANGRPWCTDCHMMK